MTLTCGQCSRDIDNPHYSLTIAVTTKDQRVAFSNKGILVCYRDFSGLQPHLKPLVFTDYITFRVCQEVRADGIRGVPDTDSPIRAKDFLGYVDPPVVESLVPRVAASLREYVEREPRLPRDAPLRAIDIERRVKRGDIEGAREIYQAALAQALDPRTPTNQSLDSIRVVGIVKELGEARWLEIAGEELVPSEWAAEFYRQRKPA